MGFKSIEELCDELLKSKVLHCTECGQLLEAPVMVLNGSHGNVCHSCFANNYTQSELFTPNTALDSLLEKLDFACEYEYCSDRVGAKNYRLHVEYCNYRTIPCEVKDCSWRGMRKLFLNHFINEHGGKTVMGDAYDIVDLKKDHWKTDILKTSCGTFVSHVMLNKDSYNFVTCDVGCTPKFLDFKVVIKCREGSKTYTVQCDIAPSNQVRRGYRDHAGMKITREALKVLFRKEPTIRWEVNVENALVVPHGKLLEFKCVSCEQFLRSPTYRCLYGSGSICFECFLADETCENCRSKTGVHLEDHALNQLVKRVRQPCSFEGKGCTVEHFPNADHESRCSHYKWVCFLCLSCLDYTELYTHFEFLHRVCYTYSDELYISGDTCTEKVKKWYVKRFGRVFGICHQCDITPNEKHFCKWSVNHIGPKDNRFFLEIELKHPEDQVTSLSVRFECQYNSTTCHFNKVDKALFNSFNGDREQYNYIMRIKRYKS